MTSSLEERRGRIIGLLNELHNEMSDFLVEVSDNAGPIGDNRTINNINRFHKTFDKFLDTARSIRHSIAPAITNPLGIGDKPAASTEMK